MSPSPRRRPPAGTDFPQGAESVLARTISAEVRARMAAQRINGRQMAELTGMSHTYLAKRLRDVLPFTLDDLDRILGFWDEDAAAFLDAAYTNHFERVVFEAEDARAAHASSDRQVRAGLDEDIARGALDLLGQGQSRDYELAAHDEDFTIEAEQEADEHP